MFRILGLLLLIIGLAGGAFWFVEKEASTIYAAAGCLFWSAMMYALAEALARLAAIEEVLRRRE